MLKFISDDACLHYRLIGQGNKTVLFLHGFLEDHSIWNTVYPHFVNKGFCCMVVDLPCHGLSRYEGEVCSMDTMARALNEFLGAQNITSAHVIGHSMGGYVGLKLLELQPLLRLTLLHSHFWEDSADKKNDRNRVIEIVKKNKNLFLSEAIPNLFAPANRQACAAAISHLIEKAAKIPAAEIAAATAGMRDRSAAYEIAGSGRVTCIQGTDDPVVPQAVYAAEVEKLVRPPRVEWIQHAAHMSIWEQHEALINALESMLIE